jgi:hypothetical protein
VIAGYLWIVGRKAAGFPAAQNCLSAILHWAKTRQPGGFPGQSKLQYRADDHLIKFSLSDIATIPERLKPNSKQRLYCSGEPLRHPRANARVTVSAACLVAAMLTFGGSSPAYGALGGNAASVQADQVHMQGSLRTTAAAGYTVQEIRSAGTLVREYVSGAGQVFGVAWEGRWPPDLRQVLGSYFEQYVQAARTQNGARGVRRPLSIESQGLVVQIGGHPRAFFGRAYVAEQLPANVRAEDIR